MSDLRIKNIKDMKEAARKIYELGPKNVLIKEGHLLSNEAVDLLYDVNIFKEFKAEKD